MMYGTGWFLLEHIGRLIHAERIEAAQDGLRCRAVKEREKERARTRDRDRDREPEQTTRGSAWRSVRPRRDTA